MMSDQEMFELRAVMHDLIRQRRRKSINAAWLAAEAMAALGFGSSKHEQGWIAAHRQFTGMARAFLDERSQQSGASSP